MIYKNVIDNRHMAKYRTFWIINSTWVMALDVQTLQRWRELAETFSLVQTSLFLAHRCAKYKHEPMHCCLSWSKICFW